MYQAVIVDDEKKICSLILELGDWERFGIQVAAVCEDGEEAWEQICRIRPDLVLTDIRMPVYDGLELIRKTAEKEIPAAFVIISGYKYFEYAYSALKYGVMDYLLKPIEKEQLNGVLEKAVELLGRRKRQKEAEQELKQLSEKIELGHRAQMFDALFSPQSSFPETAEQLEAVYQKRFPQKLYQVLFLRTNRNLQQAINLLLAQKIQEAVKRVFPPEAGFHPCVEIVSQGMGVILNFSESCAEGLHNRMRTLLYDVREAAELFGCSWVSIGAGARADSLKGLPSSARGAWQAEQIRLVMGGNQIWEQGQVGFSRMNSEMILTQQKRKEFQMRLEAADAEGLRKWFQDLFRAMEKNPPISPPVLERTAEQLMNLGETYAKANQAEESYQEFLQAKTLIWEEEAGLEAVWNRLGEETGRFVERVREETNSRESIPIRLAKAYIEEHYWEPITLEKTAEAVGLSPAYFSTNFKKFQKRTFTDYLTSVRLEAAKELLSTTQKTNYEIAVQVGYADDKYFCKVFKREVGIRPGEYRKLYYRGGQHETKKG